MTQPDVATPSTSDSAGVRSNVREDQPQTPVPSPTGSGGSVTGWASAFGLMARDIKLAHSIFALPFAILGGMLAFRATPTGIQGWGALAGAMAIIVACMVTARTWAMLFNRLVDRGFDAANPRTARRAFASGAVPVWKGWVAAGGAAGLFGASASLFWFFFNNPWPGRLSLPVLAWIALYSLTKRFTALCHVFLGGALAASPIAAAIAMDPGALGTVFAVWWLALFVLLWVAGFDIIYAVQDEAFDRGAGLSSIPARLGTRGALWVSRGLHAGALLALAACWTTDPRLGPIFGTGVGLVAALLVVEHVVAATRGQRGINMAFFTINGVVSCVLGALGVVDVVM